VKLELTNLLLKAIRYRRFYRATLRSYASAVLGVVILSVRPSVRPTVCHTRALWLIQRTYRRYFHTTSKSNPSFLISNISA